MRMINLCSDFIFRISLLMCKLWSKSAKVGLVQDRLVIPFTSNSAIAERPRCRVRYSFRQK